MTARKIPADELAEAEPRYGAYDGGYWGMEDGLREENTRLREQLAERGRERDAARDRVRNLERLLDERGEQRNIARRERDAARAEVERLRARDETAKAVVQWWVARKASRPTIPPSRLHVYDGVDALDALARAHEEKAGGQDR